MISYIEYNEFEKVDIRVGTIIEAKENNLIIVDELNISQPKTAEFNSLLSSLKLNDKKVLVLAGKLTANLRLSIRNLPNVSIVNAGAASTYELLNHDILLFDKEGLLLLNKKLSS